MSFIVAKANGRRGSVAIDCDFVQNPSYFLTDFSKKIGKKNIEIVLISELKTYGEYGPFSIKKSEKEFIDEVNLMAENEEYLSKLELSFAQAKEGKVVKKTMEELEKLAES